MGIEWKGVEVGGWGDLLECWCRASICHKFGVCSGVWRQFGVCDGEVGRFCGRTGSWSGSTSGGRDVRRGIDHGVRGIMCGCGCEHGMIAM